MFIPNTAPQTRGNSWFLGLDLGQRQDFTAIVTLSCAWIRVPKLILRDIDRFPLGTSYSYYPAALDRRLAQIRAAESAANQHALPVVSLAVDASGPGGPIVDELRRARLDVAIRPHLITGGLRPSRTSNGDATVPRKALLANLTLLIDSGRLVVPTAIGRWQTLLDELLALNAATTHPARSAAHDDMVMALALAAWQAIAEIPGLRPRRQVAPAGWRPAQRLFQGRSASHFFRKSEPIARSHDP